MDRGVPSIFIVEDEEYLQELYMSLLPDAGYRIAGVASNGDEAARALASMAARPDLILMDHRLPGKSGMQLTAEILVKFPDQKVIFVSADGKLRGEATRVGAVGFIEKPFTLRDLYVGIQNAIELK